MVDHFTNKGLKVTGLWEQVEIPLLIFQSAAVFEVKKKILLPIFSNLLFNACLFILFLDCTQCYRHHPQQCWNYFCSSFFQSFSPLANPLLCYWDKRSVWIPPVIGCLDCYWSSSLPLLHLEFTICCASNFTVVQVNTNFTFGFIIH